MNYKDKLIVSSNDSTYLIDNKSGSIISKKNFQSEIRPIIIDNFIFLITKNNFLILMNIQNGDLIYSYNIVQKIADFLNTKQKKIKIKSFAIANNRIFIFLDNSYLLKFNLKGVLENIEKLPSQIYSNPIFVDGKLLYLSNKNKIFIIN